MVADTYDPILGLIEMGVGNNNNNWGTIFNTSVTGPAARAIAGVNTITDTSGTKDLSTTVPPTGLRLDVDAIQLLTGALVGDLTVEVVNVSKTWLFWNRTSGAHSVFVQVPSGVSPTGNSIGGRVHIPQGRLVKVLCDGNGNLIRDDDHLIGTFAISGKATAGAGEVACDGTSYLRTALPDLFNKIGTTWGAADGTHFNVPNFTDTNRFLRAGGGSGPAVGTYQSSQISSHTHTGTGTITGTTDSQGAHTHGVSDPGHTHTISGFYPQAGAGGGNLPTTGNSDGFNNPVINPATTGISINSAGAHTHSVSGSCSFTTNATGGAETRPESAAVLMCIRY